MLKCDVCDYTEVRGPNYKEHVVPNHVHLWEDIEDVRPHMEDIVCDIDVIDSKDVESLLENCTDVKPIDTQVVETIDIQDVEPMDTHDVGALVQSLVQKIELVETCDLVQEMESGESCDVEMLVHDVELVDTCSLVQEVESVDTCDIESLVQDVELVDTS